MHDAKSLAYFCNVTSITLTFVTFVKDEVFLDLETEVNLFMSDSPRLNSVLTLILTVCSSESQLPSAT